MRHDASRFGKQGLGAGNWFDKRGGCTFDWQNASKFESFSSVDVPFRIKFKMFLCRGLHCTICTVQAVSVVRLTPLQMPQRTLRYRVPVVLSVTGILDTMLSLMSV